MIDTKNASNDNCLCISIFFTNTSYSYTTVEFSDAEVFENNKKLAKWIYSVTNQSNPKLYLDIGDVGEIVFYTTVYEMKSYDSKEIIMNLILENRFGERYKEMIIINPMLLSKRYDGSWYIHLSVQSNQIISKNSMIDWYLETNNCSK